LDENGNAIQKSGAIMKNKPGLSKRKTTAKRVIGKIIDFVDTFISGIAAA
jgi:type I restriction enzyme, R subunit